MNTRFPVRMAHVGIAVVAGCAASDIPSPVANNNPGSGNSTVRWCSQNRTPKLTENLKVTTVRGFRHNGTWPVGRGEGSLSYYQPNWKLQFSSAESDTYAHLFADSGSCVPMDRETVYEHQLGAAKYLYYAVDSSVYNVASGMMVGTCDVGRLFVVGVQYQPESDCWLRGNLSSVNLKYEPVPENNPLPPPSFPDDPS